MTLDKLQETTESNGLPKPGEENRKNVYSKLCITEKGYFFSSYADAEITE